MEERDYTISLYERYKDLLTEKQRIYFESHYFNDLSLNEIGELYSVSKSYVGKAINGVELKLKEYESVLHLKEKEDFLFLCMKCDIDSKLKQNINDILFK